MYNSMLSLLLKIAAKKYNSLEGKSLDIFPIICYTRDTVKARETKNENALTDNTKEREVNMIV